MGLSFDEQGQKEPDLVGGAALKSWLNVFSSWGRQSRVLLPALDDKPGISTPPAPLLTSL